MNAQEKTKTEVALLNSLIKQVRELRNESVKSDELNEEQLHYLNEGYRQGLCSVALMLADEIDARKEASEPRLIKEEEWWQQEELKQYSRKVLMSPNFLKWRK